MGTVLVTGGTTRLGRRVADRIRATGRRVIVSSHRPDSGADVIADLSSPLGAAKLYAAALAAAPDLDAIVNNAAVLDGDPAAVEMVDFTSPEKLTMLLAGREGVKCAVVNILDSAVPSSPAADDTPYANAKRRLREYTVKSAALFAETLRVNAVEPGAVLPPEAGGMIAGERLLDVRPSPDDVADAVLYLLSAKSVTGAIIPVDSGSHLLRGTAG